MRRYGTEADARRWFEEARWPNGPVCPRCGVECRSSRISTRARQLACLDCQHRYSVTSGTALHDTKLPLHSVLVTDELPEYVSVGLEYANHLRVRHSDNEFARTCDDTGLRVHVNTAESFNAMLKRGIVGVFHDVSRKHLHRYVAETAFRWNERGRSALERLELLVHVSEGPLTYRTLTA